MPRGDYTELFAYQPSAESPDGVNILPYLYARSKCSKGREVLDVQQVNVSVIDILDVYPTHPHTI